MGSSTERVVSPILISPSLNLGEGEGWSVKALGTFFLLHYITLHGYYFFLLFPSGSERRREKTNRS